MYVIITTNLGGFGMKKIKFTKSGLVLILVGLAVIIAFICLWIGYINSKKVDDLTKIMESYRKKYQLDFEDYDTIYVSTLKEAGYEVNIAENCFDDSYVVVIINGEGKYAYELIKVCGSNIILTLNGNAEVTLEYGKKYIEQGATAKINGVDATDSIKINNNINYKELGDYQVNYTISRNGQETKVTRSVSIVDTTKPTIRLKGGQEKSITVGTKYVDPGYEAIDNYDGNITNAVKVQGEVNYKKVGDYQVVYTVTDSSGNIRTVKRTIRVVEATFPIINLKGYNVEYVDYPEGYIEPGYTAIDKFDGNITSAVKVSGTVNSNIPGAYTLTYQVTNSHNKTTTVTRTVIVQLVSRPVISLAQEIVVIDEGLGYDLMTGVNATDDFDGDITNLVEVTSSPKFDANIPGTYVITYNVENSFGQTAKPAMRTIIIKDITAPTIILNGEANIYLDLEELYLEQGATAHDNVDKNLEVNIFGLVDRYTPGVYYITYNVKDLSGNVATEVIRTVYVAERTALKAALNVAKNKIETDYTADSWASFQIALMAAKALPAGLQAEVDAKTEAINAALDLLVALNRKALNNAINNALSKNESDYMPDGWLLFKEQLEKALALPEKDQDDLDAKTKMLNDAMTILEESLIDQEQPK